MANPLVSVLMTAFNRENFIGEAIESVLASTYSNFELIIVDDCSRDSTVSIAQSYADKDQRISVHINEKNLGDYPNRNKAASYANGFYIMHLDSDDTIYNDGIEKCVNWISTFPNANFAMVNFFNGEKNPFVIKSIDAIRTHFLKQPFLGVGPGGTIIKRSFFESIDGFPERFGPSNDMFFNLKAVAQTDVVLLPEEFHFYRKHEGQEINTYNSNQNRYIYSNYLYYKAALTELNVPLTKKETEMLLNKNRRRFLVNIFRFYQKTRDLKAVWKNIKISKFGFTDFIKGIIH